MTLIRLDDQFMEMVDDLVRMSDTDQELKDGLAWLDNESKKLGLSFYETFFIVLQRRLAEEKAKKWLRDIK